MQVLVTAASKHGATAEIAAAIGKHLEERGATVTVTEPAEVADVDGYDAVVVGSAVYAGHWLEDARALVDRLGDALSARPVWLFSSGPVGDPPKPEEDPVDVIGALEATGARGHKVFAGRIDKGRLGFGEKAIVVALRVPEGDYRDWDDIASWASEIAGAIQVAPG